MKYLIKNYIKLMIMYYHFFYKYINTIHISYFTIDILYALYKVCYFRMDLIF